MAVSADAKAKPDPAPRAEALAAVRLRGVSFAYPLIGVTLRSALGKALGRVGGEITQERKRVEIRALDNVDLDIPRGSRLGIRGHNGAGKSTLLRVIAGIYQASAGTVEVAGKVAAVFDKTLGMDPELTGHENIRVRGMFLGLSDREVESRIDEIVEFCELGEYLHLPMRVYSPGMRARLGFSVSTAFDADVLLLDEWLGVGDRRFNDRARERMKAFYQRAGTVVLVSHNEKLIEDNCDSVIVLERGRIVEHQTL